jgi:pSer/pThr/pTyr-binding forkhead associated (FHA) protein
VTEIPGVLVLWSGGAPRRDVLRIPEAGLELGRDHAHPSDERISRRHLKLRIDDRWLIAIDLRSRNGSYVRGRALPPEGIKTWLPAVFRIGRTTGIVVSDIRPYEELSLFDEGVGPVLERARQQVDEAARAEENVTIQGPAGLAMELARRYADLVGGSTLVFDAHARPTLDDVLVGTRPRTVILGLAEHALSFADMPTIRTWLETDVRFVTVMTPNTLPLSMLEPEAVASLRRRVVEVWPRFEVLPTKLASAVRAIAPKGTVHANAVEVMALALCTLDEAEVFERFARALARWVPTDQPMLRGDVLRDELFPADSQHCLIGRR